MDIKDLLDKEMTEEEIEGQIISQGYQVLQVISHPGWQVVLSTLLAVKTNIEKERANGVRNQTNGERALYFSGRVDGFSEAIESIYNVIKTARGVEDKRKVEATSGDD